jgi:cold shock CspA family protein
MSLDSATVTASAQDIDESVNYCGRVKWFNNKAGYGFCTVVGDDGSDRVGEDIFVHHTGVKVDSEQYKYLVQGEYVHFHLMKSDSNAHPFQACGLTGMWGGKLMCETRNEQRQQHEDNSEKPNRRRPRKQASRDKSGDDWVLSEKSDV